MYALNFPVDFYSMDTMTVIAKVCPKMVKNNYDCIVLNEIGLKMEKIMLDRMLNILICFNHTINDLSETNLAFA